MATYKQPEEWTLADLEQMRQDFARNGVNILSPDFLASLKNVGGTTVTYSDAQKWEWDYTQGSRSGVYDFAKDSVAAVRNAESWYQMYPGEKSREQHVREQLALIEKIATNIQAELEAIAKEAGTDKKSLAATIGTVAITGSPLLSTTTLGAGIPLSAAIALAGTLTVFIAGLIDARKKKALQKEMQYLATELAQLEIMYHAYAEELKKYTANNTARTLAVAAVAIGLIKAMK